MQLSSAWLENLDKGTVPKGDDSARAVRAASPLKAVYAFGMLTLIVVYLDSTKTREAVG
jgi:hypothetical protein